MPFILDEHEVHITTSIGIVLSATGYTRGEDVLRDADIAMYRAKAHGKARYEIFDPAMRDRIMERLTVESQLRQAIDDHELKVYYQPILSLTTGQLAGLEALVRWQHPDRGMIYPIDFVPLAEETGLIIPLDRYVLREACQQLATWHRELPTDPQLTVSVNLSGKQLAQPDLVEAIQAILDSTGLDPHYLKLEITESAIMNRDVYAARLFNQLQQMGVQIQIDDFGVGYSSLSYLAYFSIDAVKIDRSFVSKVASDSSHAKIVQAIVTLSHSLGMEVIAEGLETEEQMNHVRNLGCEYGQGLLLLEPLDSENVPEVLNRARAGERFIREGALGKDLSIGDGSTGNTTSSELGANLSMAVSAEGV
jgi:EAL domain-containing protein (putative c-di-GMP-specific phosphodiesterase class I)